MKPGDFVKSIDHEIQETRLKAKDSVEGDRGWEQDQKLIAMYSKGIQGN